MSIFVVVVFTKLKIFFHTANTKIINKKKTKIHNDYDDDNDTIKKKESEREGKSTNETNKK